MSKSIPSQQSVQVSSFVWTTVDKVKNIKKTEWRPLLEGIITFCSIIGMILSVIQGAYYIVSLSFNEDKVIEEWTGLQFTNGRTELKILIVFAFYLIGLKILHAAVYKYETTPPKKPVPVDWEAQQPTEKAEEQAKQHQKRPLSSDSYSVLIEKLINYSSYGLVFIFCTTSYTFVSVFNKKNKLVQRQQIIYLSFWFVCACIFYSFGKILGKLAKINTFHHFGLAIGTIVLIIELGLAHGFNMFVFI